MDMCFGSGNEIIDGQSVLYHLGGESKTADEFPYFRDGSMMMVMMGFSMLIGGVGHVIVHVPVMMLVLMRLGRFFPFHLTANGDGHMASGNAAFLFLPDREDGSAVKRAVQGVQNRFGLLMQFQQSGGQHIAGGTHATVQIKCFHRFSTSFMLPVR